jgi:hypothetical protein
MKEKEMMNVPAVSTRSGRRVALLNPSPAQIVIGDIAHGLAHQCRFNGQTNRFYSVAQHSVLVASILPRELRLAGLLHDASEAYLGDIVQPLKELLPEYQSIEAHFCEVLGARFNVDLSPNSAIHKADLIVLATERRDLMPMDTADWSCIAGITPLSRRIKPLAPEAAAAQFMDLFFKLSPKTMPVKKTGALKQWLNHYFPNRLSLS